MENILNWFRIFRSDILWYLDIIETFNKSKSQLNFSIKIITSFNSIYFIFRSSHMFQIRHKYHILLLFRRYYYSTLLHEPRILVFLYPIPLRTFSKCIPTLNSPRYTFRYEKIKKEQRRGRNAERNETARFSENYFNQTILLSFNFMEI